MANAVSTAKNLAAASDAAFEVVRTQAEIALTKALAAVDIATGLGVNTKTAVAELQALQLKWQELP